MKFYLGLHILSHTHKVDVPFFISIRPLLKRKKLIEGDWILDSGGFTELSMNGEYTISEDTYVEIIKRFKPNYAFCQDWMTEKEILKKTGKTVKEHQTLTLKSYLNLKEKIDNIAPILQGRDSYEFLKHAEEYSKYGTNMSQTFGLGSICRRRDTHTINRYLIEIKKEYPCIRIHGFGLKTSAFNYPDIIYNLESSDSMAWSLIGRINPANERCLECKSKTCANCLKYALLWRDKIINQINETLSSRQPWSWRTR